MEGEPPTPAGELPALLIFVGYHSLSQPLVSTDDNGQIPLLLVVDSGCDDRRCSWDGDPRASSRKDDR